MGQPEGFIVLLLICLVSFSRAQVTSLPASDVNIAVGSVSSIEERDAFTCTESGVFSVAGSCQDYYRCEDLTGEGLEWSVLLLRCPPEKAFNVDSKNCQVSSGRPECDVWSPYVEDLSDKIQDVSSTKRFIREAATSSIYCNVEDTSYMMRDANRACEALRSIENYVEDISKKQLLQVPYFDRDGRHSFLEDYNRDLITAQKNCHEWEHVAVMRTISDTYTLAKEFDTKFHDLLLETVSIKIDENSTKVTKKMIVDLTDKLSTQRKMLLDSVSTAVKALITKGIEENKQKLQKLQRDYDRLENENGYASLRQFLEFAQNKSKVIEGNIKDSLQKMEAFHLEVTKDLSSFERHDTVAEQQIAALKSQKEANQVEISNLKTEKARQNAMIRQLSTQLSNTRSSMGRRRKRAAPLLIFLAAAALAGGGVYWYTNEEKKRNRMIIEAHEATIRSLNSQIEYVTLQIDHYDERMTNIEQRSQAIDKDLTSLGNLEVAFQNLKNEVTTVLPAFSKAKVGLESIVRIVHEVRQNLEYLASQTTDATTAIDMRNMLYFIYNNITDLKCNWDRAIHGISVLGECL